MANGVIDTLMAGRLSSTDLAAVGIGASIYATVFVTAMGVLLALTPVVAHHYGAGRYTEIGADVRQCAWLAVLLSVATFTLLKNPDPLLAILFDQISGDVQDALELSEREKGYQTFLGETKAILGRTLSPDQRRSFLAGLLSMGHRVADASGGFFGLGNRISEAEGKRLDEVSTLLGLPELL